MKTLVLLDGPHELSPPTFYALTLMQDYGVTFDEVDPRNVTGMLAALLTDSEPLVDGEPAKVWTPTMVAKVIDPATLADTLEVVTELLLEAFPVTKGDAEPARPTKAQAGSKSE